jgi:hypothetical protein
MVFLTREQRKAVLRLYRRDPQGLTYRAFRRTVCSGLGWASVAWCGMYVGIEPDGYTHTYRITSRPLE